MSDYKRQAIMAGIIGSYSGGIKFAIGLLKGSNNENEKFVLELLEDLYAKNSMKWYEELYSEKVLVTDVQTRDIMPVEDFIAREEFRKERDLGSK